MSNESIKQIQKMEDEREKALGLSKSIGEARIGQDTLHTEEALDATARLEFHEQMQLSRLNGPLDKQDIAYQFTPADLRRADPRECDVFWNTREVYPFPGQTYAMALVDSTRGVGKDGLIQNGVFNSIFITDTENRERGGKLVVLPEKHEDLPKGEVQGRFVMENGMLEEVNGRLGELNRVKLSDGVTEPKADAPKVVGYKIYPDKEEVVAKHPDIKGSIDWMYNKGHVDLVLETDDGSSVSMTLNALTPDKKEGGVNLIRFTDGKYGMVNSVRMLQGAGRDRYKELSRGYGDTLLTEYTKRLKAAGYRMSAENISMETGLNVSDAIHREEHRIHEDFAYANITPTLTVVTFDKDKVMETAPKDAQQLMDEFEGISATKVSEEEALDMVMSNDGRMIDGFSLTGLSWDMINRKVVKFNPRMAGQKVILEERNIHQLDCQNTLVVPQAPAFEKGPRTVQRIHQNAGSSRFWRQARYSNNVSDLPVGRKYVEKDAEEVVGMMANLKFSVPDQATLFKVFLSEKILVPNN